MNRLTPNIAPNLRLVHSIHLPESKIVDLAARPTKNQFAVATREGSVYLGSNEGSTELTSLVDDLIAPRCLVFSPDGKQVAVNNGASILLIDPDNPDSHHQISHGNSITALAFSDGNLVTGDADGKLLLWDLSQNAIKLKLLDVSSEIVSLASHESWIAAATTKTIYLFEAKTHNPALEIALETPVRDLALSDEMLVAVAGESTDTRILCWDLSGQPMKKEIEARFLHRANFNSDGSLLVAAGFDHSRAITVWDAASGNLLTVTQGGHLATFNADGSQLLTATSARVSIWEADQKPESYIVGTPRKPVSIDNVSDVTNIGVLYGHGAAVMSLAFHPHQPLLASGSKDRSIRLWDINTGQESAVLHGHKGPVTSLAFHPDLPLLLSTAGDFGSHSEVYFWDLETLTYHEDRTITYGATFRTGLAIHPEGTMFAAGKYLYSLPEGTLLETLGSHRAGVNRSAFSADGSLVALAVGTDTGYSAQVDNAVKVYDSQTAELVHEFHQHKDWVHLCVFASAHLPEGELVLGVDQSGYLFVWNVQTGDLVGRGDSITAVCPAPTGNLLAVANKDYTLRLLELESGGEGHQLSGHMGRVHALAFNVKGTIMASAGDDKTIRLWGSAM